MYSALKVNGRKLCDLARQGIEVERKTREIEIFSINVAAVSLPCITIKGHISVPYARISERGQAVAAVCKSCFGSKQGGFC